MNRLVSLRRHPLLLGWLTLVWVGLWGSASAANIAGGLVVAVGLLLLLPLPPYQSVGRVHPLGMARFVVYFAGELLRASLIVVWQVLHPGAPLRQAVFAVEVAATSDRLLTMIANSISLTPGTLTLEVDRERSIIYVHALNIGAAGVAGARESVLGLQRAAVNALGSQADRERLAELIAESEAAA